MSSKTCFAKSSCIVLASAFFCTSLPALAASSTAGTNLAIQQQDQKLKGQVIDAQTGDPVIGVNVLVKGTTNGTITDIDGKYELTYIIHSGFISGYQNRYGDNLKPPTNVYHRMTA